MGVAEVDECLRDDGVRMPERGCRVELGLCRLEVSVEVEAVERRVVVLVLDGVLDLGQHLLGARPVGEVEERRLRGERQPAGDDPNQGKEAGAAPEGRIDRGTAASRVCMGYLGCGSAL